jgi:type VI secretion system secreted protein Hcp
MKKRMIWIFMLMAICMLFPLSGYCAETVHLYLKANGQDIRGESTVTSLGRENSIQCLYYEQCVTMSTDVRTGMASGRRSYTPILIRKRIDKSSPLLYRALVNNQKVDGYFRFFRPNPTGDGTTEQFYTVDFKNARIASIKQISPDIIKPTSATEPPVEEVTIVFQTITWTYTNGGITATDSFK